MRKLIASAMAITCCTASAQAACWNDDQADAAQVRELETMMMVSALRCRGRGHEMITRYNRFVAHSRPALVQANDRLRAHFAASGSGLNGYDRYVTSLANLYGGEAKGLNCAQLDLVFRAAHGEQASFANLRSLARDVGVSPDLPGGRCAVRIAKR